MVQAMSDCIDGGGVQLKPLDLTNVALTVLDNSKVVVPSHPDRDCVLQSVETTDADGVSEQARFEIGFIRSTDQGGQVVWQIVFLKI